MMKTAAVKCEIAGPRELFLNIEKAAGSGQQYKYR